MFCSNCGAKLADGSKFCSECGISLSGGNSQRRSSSVLTRRDVAGKYSGLKDMITDYHNTDSRTQDLMWMIVIEAAFEQLFNKKQQFSYYGTNIYTIGIDAVTRELKENIGAYCASDDPEEVPLLVFDYNGKGLLREGFAVTNRRFLFTFSGKGQQEFLLRELKDVNIGKALLANVMYLLTVDGVKSDKIFLTGAGDEAKFATTFRKFVLMINEAYNFIYGSVDEDDYEKYEAENISGTDGLTTEKIASACHSVQFGFADDCEIGNPVLASTKKLVKMRKTLQIPDNEDVFLIYGVTGFNKGLAICRSGVYYSGDDGRDYLGWEDFASASITVGIMNTSVSINYNQMGVGFAGKKLAMILQALQDYLR